MSTVFDIQRQSGVTLLEVLVTMLVVAIGLLSMASLQLNGLRSNHDAYYRTHASTMVSDLADRMRANLDAARAGSYAFASAPSDPGYDCRTTFAGGTACTAEELATADIYDWYDRLTDATDGLPLGEATASCALCDVGTPYTITVSWDENRDGEMTGLPDDAVLTVVLVP